MRAAIGGDLDFWSDDPAPTDDDDDEQTTRTCPDCNGRGRGHDGETCATCNGSGRVPIDPDDQEETDDDEEQPTD